MLNYMALRRPDLPNQPRRLLLPHHPVALT